MAEAGSPAAATGMGSGASARRSRRSLSLSLSYPAVAMTTTHRSIAPAITPEENRAISCHDDLEREVSSSVERGRGFHLDVNSCVPLKEGGKGKSVSRLWRSSSGTMVMHSMVPYLLHAVILRESLGLLYPLTIPSFQMDGLDAAPSTPPDEEATDHEQNVAN
ncbi:hypothetical protein GW17_00011715 [Ensete ventricosum]|nr:hypothetical protein GW17_00011715 [Ensete ventricosum]